MIISIVGGIGSGKTLSAVRFMKDSGHKAFCNFKVKIPGVERLKYDMIVEKVPVPGAKKTIDAVNFGFWQEELKKGEFDIYIDEIQNCISSRSSMSSQNKLWNRWVSQIRKVMNDSRTHHLYLLTQRPGSIDVHFRELTHVWILCKKFMKNGLVMIRQYYFRSLEELEFFQWRGLKTWFLRRQFLANSYFKLYNTAGFIDFGNEEYV